MKILIEESVLRQALEALLDCDASFDQRRGKPAAVDESITTLTVAIAELEKADQLKDGLQPLVDSCKSAKYRRDINTAVDRFLCWKLPEDFYPDAGISFDRQHDYESYRWPIGTNLFTAPQAKAMFEHCLEGTGYVLHPSDNEKLP